MVFMDTGSRCSVIAWNQDTKTVVRSATEDTIGMVLSISILEPEDMEDDPLVGRK